MGQAIVRSRGQARASDAGNTRSIIALESEAIIQALSDAIANGDDFVQGEAIDHLSDILSRSFGAQLAHLTQQLRETDCLSHVLKVLRAGHSSSQVKALQLVKNVTSNDLDPLAYATKEQLHKLGTFRAVVPLLHSGSETEVACALGVIQDLCTHHECGKYLMATGADTRLDQLANGSPSSDTAHAARNCLLNMRTVLAPNFVPDPRLGPAPSFPSMGWDTSRLGRVSTSVEFAV